jgi:hypothetical protein
VPLDAWERGESARHRPASIVGETHERKVHGKDRNCRLRKSVQQVLP